jgi:hypothetical protein
MKKEFKFWRENKIANEFTLTPDELKEKYAEWLKGRDNEWIEYYGRQCMFYFIIDKTGLNSVNEKNDIAALAEILKNT